jgi:hypothetical protein
MSGSTSIGTIARHTSRIRSIRQVTRRDPIADRFARSRRLEDTGRSVRTTMLMRFGWTYHDASNKRKHGESFRKLSPITRAEGGSVTNSVCQRLHLDLSQQQMSTTTASGCPPYAGAGWRGRMPWLAGRKQLRSFRKHPVECGHRVLYQGGRGLVSGVSAEADYMEAAAHRETISYDHAGRLST